LGQCPGHRRCGANDHHHRTGQRHGLDEDWVEPAPIESAIDEEPERRGEDDANCRDLGRGRDPFDDEEADNEREGQSGVGRCRTLTSTGPAGAIIQRAVWLYLRFTLSYRDVEELLAERGLDISYETVRCWVLKFGPVIARRLRRCRPRPSNRRHLDEMVVRIAGERMYPWRAVDYEGEVLDMLVQRRRDTRAALRLMRKLLKKQGFAPK
jgi:hypothetical protein